MKVRFTLLLRKFIVGRPFAVSSPSALGPRGTRCARQGRRSEGRVATADRPRPSADPSPCDANTGRISDGFGQAVDELVEGEWIVADANASGMVDRVCDSRP